MTDWERSTDLNLLPSIISVIHTEIFFQFVLEVTILRMNGVKLLKTASARSTRMSRQCLAIQTNTMFISLRAKLRMADISDQNTFRSRALHSLKTSFHTSFLINGSMDRPCLEPKE